MPTIYVSSMRPKAIQLSIQDGVLLTAAHVNRQAAYRVCNSAKVSRLNITDIRKLGLGKRIKLTWILTISHAWVKHAVPVFVQSVLSCAIYSGVFARFLHLFLFHHHHSFRSSSQRNLTCITRLNTFGALFCPYPWQ